NPAFLALPDGRYLAMYTQHGVERRIYYAFSEPHNPLKWGTASTFDTPGGPAQPLRGNNVTYSNLFRLASGRILNFFRGVGLEPNYMYSDDTGRTWHYGGRVAHGTSNGYSPYLKYAFDGVGTIHFVMTENHPRNYDNSLYHAFIRDGGIYLSNGTRRAKLSETTETDVNTRDSGATWRWEPITANSTVDNLRPIVPRWKDARTALVWMRGTYRNNHGEWTTAVVATILPPAPGR